MPDSQENDWQDLGYTSEVELVRSAEDWDEIVEHFQRAIRQFNALYVPVEAASHAMRAFAAQSGEDMAIDIRHSEYPKWDSYETYWYDPSGFHTDVASVCFICERPTHRLDIDFHAHFCGSDECNQRVREDLERLNGGPEVRD